MTLSTSSAKPRLLSAGWWEGVPETFRKPFERKTLREGYLLNLDGRVEDLVFFRGAYQARVLDGKDAFLCRYRHVPAATAPLQGNCECSCETSTVRFRCAHQAALLFRVLSDAQGRTRQGGDPVGAGYAGSLWSQLALGLCRSQTGAGLRLALQPGRAVLTDASGLPVMEIPRDVGTKASEERDLLPEGWETSLQGDGFAAWAHREIRAEDLALLKALGQAPAQRAEFGPAGFFGRAAYLRAPRPEGRLDWEDGGGCFRIRLHAVDSDFTAWALLNIEQAYSLHRKFPSLILGEGFAAGRPEWRKVLEMRVADGSRLRIRPFALALDGEVPRVGPSAGVSQERDSQGEASAGDGDSEVTRVYPPAEGEGIRFGDMTYLPGVGFRRLRPGTGPLFRRYTGWKTYWIEPANVPDFLRKHGRDLVGPDCDADLLLGNPRAAAITSIKVNSHGREGTRFRVGMEYRLGDARLDLSRLKALRDAGLPCLITSAGWVDFFTPEWAWIGQIKAEDWIQAGEEVHVLLDSPLLARVCAMHAPQVIEVDGKGGPGLEFLPSLAEGSREGLSGWVPDAELPVAGLRPYQVDGLRWLTHLATLGLSGILADDMGLGKTHQVMALMAWLQRQSAGRDRTLVVCPTSVLYHWKERIEAFHPGLGVGVFHGSARDPEMLDQAVCITSYGIVRNDQALFRARRYALLVLDEIQYSKNRDSETHQALRDFPAGTVIGLTGTPLENNVWEVKNLFDLILPGYFPGEAQFRREVAEPMETAARDGVARDCFRRLVRPFLLRRTKAQVLPDLPEKVEEILSCDMTPDQAELYQASLRQRGGPLLRELMGAGRAPLLHVFQLLNHLKQVCNHPMTLAGAELPDREYGSGKWDLFIYLLEKSLGAGRKVVVFSQYLRMLKRIEDYLRKGDVGFATLTGATSNRPAVLKRFERNPDCRVFCCSLKAGGVGIDLTAAETVIHYDRWWNAARENQATDRVHRLGQTKNVQVFKLVTRETIEERIDAIIRRKAAWMEALIPDDPEGGIKLFTREELMELLRGAES